MGGKGSGRNRTADYAAMREYKAQGHSMHEVADHFGVCEHTAQRVCKGISPQTNRRPQQYKNGWDDEKKKANAIRIINERAPMFEYVGGFTNTDGFVDVRCKVCGSTLHKSFVSIRHGKATCENCDHVEAVKRKAHKKKVEADKRAWAKIGKVKSEQLSFSICETCGSMFFSEKSGVHFCSKECREREHNSIKKDKRIRKLKSIIVDKGINLETLYNKSNGTCALCGGICNWGDHVIRDDGTFVVGASYPSIDHIKPISKGGLHEWNNVQLAHFACNSKKSDKV